MALEGLELDFHTTRRAAEILNFIDTVRKEREDWEGNELLRSNERLYGILLKCYEAAVQMSGTDESQEKMKRAFKEYCESKSYKFQDSTPLVQKIVRVVFGTPQNWDRSRISTYGKALYNLQKDKVAPEDFIDKVKAFGGIEEVKRSAGNGEKPLSAKDFIGRGISQVSDSDSITTFTSKDLRESLDKDKPSEVVILIAVRSGNDFKIQQSIQKESVLNSVFKDIGKDVLLEEKRAADAEKKVAKSKADKESKAAALEAMAKDQRTVTVPAPSMWDRFKTKTEDQPEEETA